ncbi:FeoA family protein [Sporanaerobacter acetigenes]|uniref:Ferrous iron transport protein A n=1 Tax=Sporanaerobacter acetigenes DSM 13106 TaxID=1123281 RepID=A0A1M5VTX2_9FIRM|nr:FeoA family protein [Sporanaerobacter acetigenes]SHH78638.1 ferrous iron transport protein A [Sporanaerobacter acetigenes DSM 13106]
MENASLTQLNPGDSCTIKKIYAGNYATKRLYEMGLNTGAELKVIKNDTGPVIVSLFGNKIAVGRGLAEKIMIAI